MSSKDWMEDKKETPHDSLIWVKIDAHIKCVKTGEVVIYKTSGIFDSDAEDVHTFNWEEGNFSCDCNRHWDFQRAKGLTMSDQDHEQNGCSDGKYLVNLQNPKTGKFFYKEFEDPDLPDMLKHSASQLMIHRDETDADFIKRVKKRNSIPIEEVKL